jgi:hypothetical protein
MIKILNKTLFKIGVRADLRRKSSNDFDFLEIETTGNLFCFLNLWPVYFQ